jgi:hypothetical protein
MKDTRSSSIGKLASGRGALAGSDAGQLFGIPAGYNDR